MGGKYVEWTVEGGGVGSRVKSVSNGEEPERFVATNDVGPGSREGKFGGPEKTVLERLMTFISVVLREKMILSL